MGVTELDEIKSYWTRKYPLVDIRLWSNDENNRFYGQMVSSEGNEHFNADTIGELINLGEQYLRRLK